MFLSPRGETGVSAPDKCLDSTGTRLLWKQVAVVHRGTKASSRQSLAKRTSLSFHIPADIEDYCALESCSVRIAIGGFISKHHSAVDMLVADVLQRSLKETFSKRQKLVASDFHRTELILKWCDQTLIMWGPFTSSAQQSTDHVGWTLPCAVWQN